MNTLYENIKNRRLLLGLTQTELAEKTGYADKSMIAKIEKGIVDIPQSKVKDFAMALQTTEAYIMGLEPIYADPFDKDFIDQIRPYLKEWDNLTQEESAIKILLNSFKYDFNKLDGRIIFFDGHGGYDISVEEFESLKYGFELAAKEIEVNHRRKLNSIISTATGGQKKRLGNKAQA